MELISTYLNNTIQQDVTIRNSNEKTCMITNEIVNITIPVLEWKCTRDAKDAPVYGGIGRNKLVSGFYETIIEINTVYDWNTLSKICNAGIVTLSMDQIIAQAFVDNYDISIECDTKICSIRFSVQKLVVKQQD